MKDRDLYSNHMHIVLREQKMRDNSSFEEYIQQHKDDVENLLDQVIFDLYIRSQNHDKSKMEEPEYSMFKEFHERMLQLTFGTPEYIATVREMGEPLKHHYEQNRHHPEHFENGVNDMNLMDLIEMICDWVAVSNAKGVPVNIEAAQERFGVSDQLMSILRNTVIFLYARS